MFGRGHHGNGYEQERDEGDVYDGDSRLVRRLEMIVRTKKANLPHTSIHVNFRDVSSNATHQVKHQLGKPVKERVVERLRRNVREDDARVHQEVSDGGRLALGQKRLLGLKVAREEVNLILGALIRAVSLDELQVVNGITGGARLDGRRPQDARGCAAFFTVARKVLLERSVLQTHKLSV